MVQKFEGMNLKIEQNKNMQDHVENIVIYQVKLVQYLPYVNVGKCHFAYHI